MVVDADLANIELRVVHKFFQGRDDNVCASDRSQKLGLRCQELRCGKEEIIPRSKLILAQK